ncbi:gamma-glutamylcyclotransferase family protein [Nocardia miyunensis]|uniref:gamma-glutamylcyclotransferase family protein n=1 Tax=Nocardia miyunensis TaxID=282684 RepID=UPI000AAEF711|nr:gamma-glutamylcyclotransferase family protein [Nocardia miyunensis]
MTEDAVGGPAGPRRDTAAPAGRSSSLSRQADTLFAYGTLQFGPVLVELLGRVPDAELGVVRDRRVAALPKRAYPGLVAEPGRMASGLVLQGLTRADWEVIDAFEDEQYELRTVRVIGRDEPVPTYVWTDVVTEQDWYPEQFAVDHLHGYATLCARWRAEFARRAR